MHIIATQDILSAYAKKVTAIAYIRDPVSYISSMFAQNVHGGVYPRVVKPFYREKFEKFIVLLGRTNVEFRVYDKRQLVGGSSVSDFYDAIGISIDEMAVQRTNLRLSLQTLQCLNCLNQSPITLIGMAPFTNARNQLIGTLNKEYHTPFDLSASSVASYMDHDDIGWMETISGFSLAPVEELGGHEEDDPETILQSVRHETLERLREILKSFGIHQKGGDGLDTLIGRLFTIYLLQEFPGDEMAFAARDLALRLEKHKDFTLEDASALMSIAHKIRPHGTFIAEKLAEYRSR